MTATLALELDFRGYWLSGTGRGGGGADFAVDRDRDGAPVVRGRHLQGNLREAARSMALWRADGWSEETIDLLFGRSAAPGAGAAATLPGCIDIPDARLPDGARARLRDDPAGRAALTRFLPGVRIDPSGVAMNDMLRLVEASVPLRLFTTLSWTPWERCNADPDARAAIQRLRLEAGWTAMVRACLSAMTALGAQRSRGYGRVRIAAGRAA
ncbi:MAG: hypothetical protein EPO55_00770 [Reyranella sp.]|uniref:RAMP superfamily CRISPR-associated protein n=1 Tax=Reyranella sp. TaxID=1929291 RepID=UPI00120F09DE|nr:RAMP superfamily CRISPR-associated protein [Reyranella sp.]TAJ42794.1 MAG: hypothetical protein EPO55_00770 [Reyranella sp.]